jgi:hypothetical protein
MLMIYMPNQTGTLIPSTRELTVLVRCGMLPLKGKDAAT